MDLACGAEPGLRRETRRGLGIVFVSGGGGIRAGVTSHRGDRFGAALLDGVIHALGLGRGGDSLGIEAGACANPFGNVPKTLACADTNH